MTRTARRRPFVEYLEPRHLLTAVAPADATYHQALYPSAFVGPLPYGAHRAAFGSTYPAGYQYDEPPYGGVSSSAANSIGAALIGDVYASGTGVIADSSWKIAGGAASSQVWTTTQARINFTAGTDHSYAPTGAPSDEWNWFWDENPGTKTVTDTITYTDGTVWDITWTFKVIAPTVTFNVNVPKASTIAPNSSHPVGFVNVPVTYQGTEAVGTINGATGGFIQVINMQDTIDYAPSTTYPYGVTHGVAFPGGLYALDVPKSQATPYYINNYSVPLKYNATTTVGGPPSQGYPADAPGVYVYSNANNYGWANKITYYYSFRTYLDYCPPGGGLHVEVAEADWTVWVSAHYIGPTSGPYVNYNNPQNWNIDYNSVTGPTITYTRQLVTWSWNTDDAQSKFAT